MTTRTMSATEFQRHHGACLSEVRKGTPLIVTIHGRPEVAVIAADEYERLQEAQRHLAVLREHGAQPVEWQ